MLATALVVAAGLIRLLVDVLELAGFATADAVALVPAAAIAAGVVAVVSFRREFP